LKEKNYTQNHHR